MGTVETCFSTYLSYSETVWATLIQFGYPCSNYLGPLKDEYIPINHNCILIYDIRWGGGHKQKHGVLKISIVLQC